MILDIIFAVNIVIVVIGLVGNSLVVWVVRQTRAMRTTTNFLLVNLAAADIVTLLVNPFIHGRLWGEAAASDYLCKFLTGSGLVGLPVGVSLFTLVIIGVERYHALVKPMSTRLRLSEDNFHYAIVATWCLATAMNLPIWIDYRYDEEERRCNGVWSLDLSGWIAYYVICYSAIAIIATLLNGVCCFQVFRGLFITNTICSEVSTGEEDRRSKRKLAKLLIVVTVLFHVCHFPFNIFMITMATIQPSGHLSQTIFKVFAAVAFTNSSLNPIVYAFQSSNYRAGFKKIFGCQATHVENHAEFPMT